MTLHQIAPPRLRDRKLEDKIAKILRAWLIYLDLAALVSVKIKVDDDDNDSLIWEQGVSLSENALVLDEDLFKQLKAKSSEARAKNHPFQIAVTFPKIYQVEDGVRQFQPLFTIDLTPIFQGRFRHSGWDLTEEFKFQPVLPNLVDVAELDEEEAENLVTGESLKLFLENTFNTPVTTLQAFLNLLVLPDKPQTVQFIPYLVQFDFVSYTYNIRKDIQKILEQREDWDWVYPGHPAFDYLFGQSLIFEDGEWFAGSFPKHPPTDSQAEVLKLLRQNNLVPVVGPPGCGKTDSLGQGLAMVVVDRALRLLKSLPDESNLTLIASTTNRAVRNVEALLAEDPALAPLFLPGGAKKKKIEKQVLPLLWEAIRWLDSTPFDQAEYQATAEALQQKVDQLQAALDQDPINQQKRQQINEGLVAVNQEIRALQLELDLLQGGDRNSDALGDYSQFPMRVYKKLRKCLDGVRNRSALPVAQPPKSLSRKRQFLQPLQWLRYWFAQLRGRIARTKFYGQLICLTAQIQTTPFPLQFQLPLNDEILEEKRNYISAQIKSARIWQKAKHLQEKLQERSDRRTRLEQELAKYPERSFHSRFYTTAFHSLQQEIFRLSRHYLKQTALSRKEEVKQSLDLYVQFLQGTDQDGRLYQRFGRQYRTVFRDLSLLFPVVTSSLHSVRNLFPFPDRDSIAYAFIDEAGATSLHQLFPVLVRAQKALVVGDPMQLQPIVPFNKNLVDQYRQEAFIAQGLTVEDHDLYSPTAYEMTSAYQRAAGVQGQPYGKGDGVVLIEHFRCPRPLALLVDRFGGYGLSLRSEPIDPVLGAHLIATHVEGSQQDYVNPQEVDAVLAWVEHLYSLGYSFGASDRKKTIAVISPYRKQANALLRALQRHWQDCNEENTNTIHTFQGGQKAIVLLSTRQCQPADSLRFLNRGPNLLNVAVSRATESLIVVGNLERLKAGTYSQILVDHLKQYGKDHPVPSLR